VTSATPSEATRTDWPSHLALGLLLAATAIAGVLASALAWCVSGDFYWTVALAGAFGNPTLGLVATALLYVALRNHRRLLMASLTILFVLQTLVTIICSEFILQRGAPIAPIDVINGLDAGLIRSQASVLYSRHFGPFIALAVAIFAGALVLAGRMRRSSSRREAAVVLGVLAAFTLLSLGVHRTARGGHALRPYERLMGALVTTNHLNVIVGLEPAMLDKRVADEAAEPGLAMLGMRTASCPDGLHVFERIDGDRARDSALLASFHALSQQLGELGRPLSFMFVLLESVGAEDIHAVGGVAPEGLTPYLDSLAQGSSHVLVGRRIFQGGQRTAGAMSGMLCGVGAGPFGLAPLRDLPNVKLRCWPDLAAESGADLRFFYADNLKFDRYEGTLLDHDFRYLHTPRVEDRPRGAWGLSDRELFKDIVADLDETSPGAAPDGARIRGVLTLSTHGPFDTPDDMPDDRRDRALSLARGATDNRTIQAHWVTVSYLDHALSSFVPAFMQAEEKAGRTPVMLLVGDHTSGTGVSKKPLEAGRIAPLWVFPSAVDAKWIEPVQRELDAGSWSQNDLPRLILALLDGAGALQSLPQEARWHTMGGQALSPSFSVPPPWQKARLWSIDTLARSRLLGPSDEVLVKDIAESPSTREDLDTSQKATDQALPGLAWLLQHPERIGPCDE
jgi:Sulfatase